jgi:hypothetical protein
VARFGSRATRAASWVLRRALAVLGMLALALAAALAGVLLHLDLPAPRRVTCRLVTNLLNDFFEGQLRIGRIERLSLRRITATNIAVRDTQQRQVLEVSRMRAAAGSRGESAFAGPGVLPTSHLAAPTSERASPAHPRLDAGDRDWQALGAGAARTAANARGQDP